MAEPAYLIEILRNGASKASSTAEVTLAEVKRKTGFIVENGVRESLEIKL